MQSFLTFTSSLLDIICDFLLTEPISWFIGIFLVAAVGKFVFSLLNYKF